MIFSSYISGNNVYCDVTDGPCNYADNGNRITCDEFTILPCNTNEPGNPCSLASINNGILLCDCGDTVNCARCGNDLPYFNPVLIDDVLYFQFQQTDWVNGNDPNDPFIGWNQNNGFAYGFVKDCCTGEYLEDGDKNPISLTFFSNNNFVGVFPKTDYGGNVTWVNVQTISVNISELMDSFLAQFPDGCFTLEFQFVGNDRERYFLCTEPFQLINCDQKRTVLLEGEYTKFDCFDFYYGNQAIGSGTFDFRNTYRIPAVIEQSNFEINKETIGSKAIPVSVEIIQNYDFRSYRVPQYVAGIVANILGAEKVYGNNIEYLSGGEISKNNEVGNQWFMESRLRRITCQKNTTCS